MSDTISLYNLDKLTGYLLWCIGVITLGYLYISSLWDLKAKLILIRGPYCLSKYV